MIRCFSLAFLITLLLLSLGSCASSSINDNPQIVASPQSAQRSALQAAALNENGLQAEEGEFDDNDTLDGDALAQTEPHPAYCEDSIYIKHFKNQYKALNPESAYVKKYRSRRSRRRARYEYKKYVSHYAHKKLIGTSTPYFGGIPVVVNDQVQAWIDYFKSRGRRDFLRWVVRGEPLKKHVLPILKSEGLPTEFFYLAMVESGFNPRAFSRARASGTWQFMAPTARRYGLKINHWVDERRDPVRSTVAAARYLKDLYAQMGDWYLAMAAYNAGPGRVRRAIRRAKTRNFWAISRKNILAVETRQYVPKVLAAILLSSDPEAHGFDIEDLDHHHGNDHSHNHGDSMTAKHRRSKKIDYGQLPTSKVHIKRPVYLTELSKHLGVSRKTIKRWNPEIIRDITPPSSQGYYLRLEKHHAALFPKIESKLTHLDVSDVQMHRVRAGETLSHIARRYKVRISQIRAINPKLRAKALRIGKAIAIPIPGVVKKKTL